MAALVRCSDPLTSGNRQLPNASLEASDTSAAEPRASPRAARASRSEAARDHTLPWLAKPPGRTRFSASLALTLFAEVKPQNGGDSRDDRAKHEGHGAFVTAPWYAQRQGPITAATMTKSNARSAPASLERVFS